MTWFWCRLCDKYQIDVRCTRCGLWTERPPLAGIPAGKRVNGGYCDRCVGPSICFMADACEAYTTHIEVQDG